MNGQRQGMILEKPFCIGESITSENPPVFVGHQESLPKLSIEDEINLVLEIKKASEDASLIQEMKELGMQR